MCIFAQILSTQDLLGIEKKRKKEKKSRDKGWGEGGKF